MADKQIIAFLEKSLEGIHKAANASQEVIKSMQLQTEIRLNIKNLDKHKPNENNKALSEHEERIAANTNEFYTNIYEFLLYANFAKNSEKRFSSLNKALQELFKHASFFSLKDKERNLENINLITQQEICKSDLLFKNFAELQEHILDHSAFQYFNTLETKSLETNEETARGNIQNSILEIMEKEYQYFYDKIAEEENERNAAKIIQKAFRNFKKNKIKQRIAEMNENAPIVTRYLKKIQHTYKSGLVIQKFMEYRKYRESMEKATTPELIENSTKRLQEAIISPEKINSNIVTLETQELDKSIFPLDDLLSSQSENLRLLSEELPFFKENQVEFEKIFSDSTSDQEKIEFLGDKSQEMKLELEKSSQLAYKILELIIEVKYIEPNKNNDNPELLSEKLITLSNDLKHQLNGIKEGNKDFFLKN